MRSAFQKVTFLKKVTFDLSSSRLSFSRVWIHADKQAVREDITHQERRAEHVHWFVPDTFQAAVFPMQNFFMITDTIGIVIKIDETQEFKHKDGSTGYRQQLCLADESDSISLT